MKTALLMYLRREAKKQIGVRVFKDNHGHILFYVGKLGFMKEEKNRNFFCKPFCDIMEAVEFLEDARRQHILWRVKQIRADKVLEEARSKAKKL